MIWGQVSLKSSLVASLEDSERKHTKEKYKRKIQEKNAREKYKRKNVMSTVPVSVLTTVNSCFLLLFFFFFEKEREIIINQNYSHLSGAIAT